ncbi:MAG: CpXC domain-containing protein [Anaerolineae bacterium]
MNAPAYQNVPVTCPSCGNRFVSPVLTIIDARQNPEAKAMFLSGRINVAACPQCGHAGLLNTPIVYHDPDKELLLTYVPAELGLPEIEQQRVIGDLTNRVMSHLPPEQRKGYLLRPQSFLRIEGMRESILNADGITPEMLEAQQAKVDLLDRLIRTTSEDSRRTIAQENDQQLDYEFFQILTLNIELAQADGQEEMTNQLLELRGQLLEWTSTGHEVAAREDAIRELGSGITREGLLDKLIQASQAAEDTKIDTMIAVGRQAIDYIFYQQLTSRIEAAQESGNTTEADSLKALRERVLNVTAEVDAEIQRATEQANQLLKQILHSDDLEAAVRANLDQIDELFLNAVALNLQAAEQAGRTEEAQRLQQVGDIMMKLIQESQPPEIQFINSLLSAGPADKTQELLEQNKDRLDARMLELMRLVEEDLHESGRTELAQRLAEIQKQAASLQS